MSDTPEIYDFDAPQDPIPEYPFQVEDNFSAKDVAWLIFSRLYTRRLNPIMCIAPIGFRDELEQNFDFVCAPYRHRTVMFECEYICEKLDSTMFERIMRHRDMVHTMLIRASSLYPGTANSITPEESMLLATALGVDGVGKLIPLSIEDGNLWSNI